jgi:hypothetical protein
VLHAAKIHEIHETSEDKIRFVSIKRLGASSRLSSLGTIGFFGPNEGKDCAQEMKGNEGNALNFCAAPYRFYNRVIRQNYMLAVFFPKSDSAATIARA